MYHILIQYEKLFQNRFVQDAQKPRDANTFFTKKVKLKKKIIEITGTLLYNYDVYKSAFGYGVFMRIKRGIAVLRGTA